MKSTNAICGKVFAVAVAMAAVVACGPKEAPIDYDAQTVGTTHEVYTYAPDAPRSAYYAVTVGGDNCYVYPVNTNHDKPQLVSFGTNGLVKVEIIPLKVNPTSVVVRPLAKKFPHKIENGKIVVYLTEGDHATVEVNGDEDVPIFLYANSLEIDKPSPDAPGQRMNISSSKIKFSSVKPLLEEISCIAIFILRYPVATVGSTIKSNRTSSVSPDFICESVL